MGERVGGQGMKPRLGFLGMGIMGKPMAMNLLKAGFSVTVYNRTRAKAEAMAAHGAQVADSCREVAEKSDVVLTMVADSPDVEAVVLGPGGVIERVRSGMTVIDHSTIFPTVTRRVAERLAEKGVRMLDAPVSGGEKGAIEGTLSIMVGGEEAVFEECKPILEAEGKNIVYVGSQGMGQTVKLCNQVICVLNIQAVCEGLMLGSKAGVDMGRLLQVVTKGAASSWMLENLAPRMLARDYAPGFTVRLQQKDLRLALALAEELHLPLPGVSLVHNLFRSVEAESHADEGTQSLIKALEKLGEHQVGES